MNAPDACAAYVVLDAAFAGLLARERRQMARAFGPRRSMPSAPRPHRPWRVVEISLIFALGFFFTSLFLRIAFA